MPQLILFALLLALSLPAPAFAQRGAERAVLGIMGAIIQEGMRQDRARQRGAVRGRAGDAARPRTQRPAGATAGVAAGAGAAQRTAVRDMQAALNHFGFDVGTADGSVGPRTRAGVSGLQAFLGDEVTGRITDSQRALLSGAWQRATAGGGLVNQIVATHPEGLRGLLILQRDEMHQQVAGDGDSPIMTRRMTQEEWRELQWRLRDLGHYSGDIDGVFGLGTARAIEGFAESQGLPPEQMQAARALDMLRQAAAPGTVPGQDPGQHALLASPDARAERARGAVPFDPANYAPRSDSAEEFSLAYELGRRIIAERPDILDDDAAVARWIEEHWPSRTHRAGRPMSTNLTARFYSGVALDRADAIQALRPEVRQVQTTEPLRFTVTSPAVLITSAYDPVRGFPIHIRNDDNRSVPSTPDAHSQIRLYLRAFRQYATFYLENVPETRHLPMGEAEARELSRRLNANSALRIRLVRYVTAHRAAASSEINAYTEVEGWVGEATLDAIGLQLIDSRNGNVIETLKVWEPERGQPVADLLEYAQWAGIPVREDHLLHYSGSRSGTSPSIQINTRDQEASWRRLLYLAQVANNRSLLDRHNILLHAAGLALSDADKRTVSGGRPVFHAHRGGVGVLSEFEARAMMNNLRENYLDRILARAPRTGLRLLELTELEIGLYDFDRQVFPIVDINNDEVRNRRMGFSFLSGRFNEAGFVDMRVRATLPTLPDTIDIPEDQAEEFVERVLRNRFGARRVFLAHYGTLMGISEVDGALVSDVRTDRLVVYGGQDATIPILEIDVQAERQRQEDIRLAALRAEQDAAAEQERLAAARAATELQAEQERIDAARTAVAGLDLSVLGVRLGMTEAEATAALLADQPAFAGSLTREAALFGERTDQGGSLTVCDGARMHAEQEYAQRTGQGSAQPGTDAASRLVYDELLGGMPVECRPEFNLLGMSITSSAQLADGRMQDSVRIYFPSLGTGDARVTAVVREITLSNFSVDIPALLVERFGPPSLTGRRGGTYFWTLDGESADRAQRDRSFSEACFYGQSGFPVSRLRLTEYRFRVACGTIMGVSVNESPGRGQPFVTVYLIDTDQFVAARQAIEDARARPSAPEVIIRF